MCKPWAYVRLPWRPFIILLGILHWLRRCAENWRDGRFVLEQQTQRLRGAAGKPVARLQAAAGAASTRAGYVG